MISQPAPNTATVPKKSPGDALGSIAKIASRAQQSAAPNRKRLYKLQKAAREILPSERVADCHRVIVPGQESVEIHCDGGHAHYKNLVCCGRVWICPVCAAKITERRRAELTVSVARSLLFPVLVTYTLRHKRTDMLLNVVDALGDSFRFMKAGRWFQDFKDQYHLAGSVRSLEVTWSERNGWHPHQHELMLLTVPLDEQGIKALEHDLRLRWLHSLDKFGRYADWDHGVKVITGESAVREYVAKWGREPKDMKSWSPEREVTKANSKNAHKDGTTPWGLLWKYENGEKRAGRLFQEYAFAFKGRNQLVWSRGLRALLGLEDDPDGQGPTDEEVAADSLDRGAVLLELARVQWAVIRTNHLQADLLEVAETTPDIANVWTWLYEHQVPHVRRVDFRDWNESSDQAQDSRPVEHGKNESHLRGAADRPIRDKDQGSPGPALWEIMGFG